MAKTVGVDYARVAILNDSDETVNTKDYTADFGATGIFRIDAQTSEGLISAAITGLAPTMNKVYGSDMVVEESGKGSGSVSVALAANNIPDDVLSDLCGMQKDTASGAHYIDTDTRPPYSALEMTSHDRVGNLVHFAVLKGTFGPEEHNMQTNTDTEQMATDSVTFGAVNRKADKKVYAAVNAGQTGYVDSAWEALVFPGAGTVSNSTGQ